MTLLLILLSVILVVVATVQIGKITESAAIIKGEHEAQLSSNRFNAMLGVVFMVGFLAFCVISALYYKNDTLYYGAVVSASEHGPWVNSLFSWSLFFTGVVFIITHIALFWYAWKYRERAGSKAIFWAHNGKLEMVWMAIPAVVMTFLVIMGLVTWNKTMTDIPADAVPGKDYIEIEAVGYQFGWTLRHPGKDNLLGDRDFRLYSGENPLGVVWTDKRNLDDINPNELVIPKGKKIRIRINSKDVLHNFYLPHFHVKMDAIPGMPTYFIFTPTITTEEMRAKLSLDTEWQVPSTTDETKKRWETFDYELACAELCGKGHYSMRRVVKVVEQAEYDKWVSDQATFYDQNVKGKPNDPFWKPEPTNMTPPVGPEGEATPKKDTTAKEPSKEAPKHGE